MRPRHLRTDSFRMKRFPSNRKNILRSPPARSGPRSDLRGWRVAKSSRDFETSYVTRSMWHLKKFQILIVYMQRIISEIWKLDSLLCQCWIWIIWILLNKIMKLTSFFCYFFTLLLNKKCLTFPLRIIYFLFYPKSRTNPARPVACNFQRWRLKKTEFCQ